MSEEQKTVLAFDLETTKLASEVEREHAAELGGESPWSRPDLFGFGVGVVVDVTSGVPVRFPPAVGAPSMIALLEEADATVGYNTAGFDLGVLSPHGDVSAIRGRHIDINVLVMSGLDALPIDRQGAGRIRQGGLDGLARANGLGGKTGAATDAPALLREGQVDEVMAYCEQDTRLAAGLYRLARERGTLFVDGYLKKGSERIELGRLKVPVAIS